MRKKGRRCIGCVRFGGGGGQNALANAQTIELPIDTHGDTVAVRSHVEQETKF